MNTLHFVVKKAKLAKMHDPGCVRVRILTMLAVLFLIATGCQSVKPYQRAYLNDHEMQAGPKSIAKPEQNAMSYREGATGGGGGKASGGCGCN